MIGELVAAWQTVLPETLGDAFEASRLLWPAQQPDQHGQLSEFLQSAVSPNSLPDWWPLVSYLTRTLRLSDQRATAEGHNHELPHTFLIGRSTGTHATSFAAAGLAKLLTSSGRPVQISEESTDFRVAVLGPENGLTRLSASPGYSFLKTNEKVVLPRGAFDPVHYKAEKAKADRIKALRKGKKLKVLYSASLEAIEQDKPRPTWRLLQVLNTLQGDETSKSHSRADRQVEASGLSGEDRSCPPRARPEQTFRSGLARDLRAALHSDCRKGLQPTETR